MYAELKFCLPELITFSVFIIKILKVYKIVNLKNVKNIFVYLYLIVSGLALSIKNIYFILINQKFIIHIKIPLPKLYAKVLSFC